MATTIKIPPTVKHVRLNEARRMAWAAAAGHTECADLGAFYGDDTLDEFTEMSAYTFEKAKKEVAATMRKIERKRK